MKPMLCLGPRVGASQVRRLPGICLLLGGLLLGGAVSGTLAGCRQDRPLPQQPVPTADNYDRPRIENDPVRPLPADAGDLAPYPQDPPLGEPPPMEAGPYVQAYNAVGRPNIVVFVNRTLEGAIVPTTEERILSGRRRIVETTGGVDASRTNTSTSFEERGGYRGGSYRENNVDREERITTTGPARLEERTEIYLPPGEYDELYAKRIDYAALENALADALAVRGEVTVLTPSMVRQRLSSEELAALEAGRPAVLEGLAERLGADVLVQVQARPTAQTDRGLDLRIVAEALNTEGGESIGRANADFHPPMSAARLDQVSRYLARRLMDDMTGAWLTPADPDQQGPLVPEDPAQQALENPQMSPRARDPANVPPAEETPQATQGTTRP